MKKEFYTRKSTDQVANFVEGLQDAAQRSDEKGRVTLDSVSAAAFVSDATHKSSSVVPEKLQIILDEAGQNNTSKITKALLDGIETYQSQHGVEPSADIVEYAMHCGYTTTDHARKGFSLDSATSIHHDQLSLQPNRAVVAIIAAMSEASPIAHYLPADISSNEARLAILHHQAGKESGMYAQGGWMDGIYSGNTYISSSRINTSNPNSSGDVDGKITAVQTDVDHTDPSGDVIPLLRGRSIVYVNGQVAARETDGSDAGQSPVSGKVKISGTEYVIGGNINSDTGVYALTSKPALPAGVPVVVEGFIDYERVPALTPSIQTVAQVYKLYAKPWRAFTRVSPDSRTQLSSELGIDPLSEGVYAVQTQFANERHYESIAKLKRVAAMNQTDYDFEWKSRGPELTRAFLWQDFAASVGAVSQQMAIDTINHGVTHLYVGKNIAAQWQGLPDTVFQSSGQPERPFIYRIGRLFGKYEVYYTPKGLYEDASSSQILAVGRATDVTRNPLVFGDAVPPTLVQLAVGEDMKAGTGFYARNFTELNPHRPSSRGAALINVKNLA